MPARDRRRPFWSRWVWKDWDAKTKDLDAWEYTAYHRLLSYAATNSRDLCSVPDDDRRLARAVGMGTKRWLSVREKVLAFFVLCEAPGGVIPGRDIPFPGVLRWYRNERLREDSDAWFELVDGNKERVNQWLQRRTTAGSPEGQPQGQQRARGSEVRSKIQSDSEQGLKFGSTSPAAEPQSPTRSPSRPERQRHDPQATERATCQHCRQPFDRPVGSARCTCVPCREDGHR